MAGGSDAGGCLITLPITYQWVSSLYLSSISLYAYPHDVLVMVETGLVIVLELSFCVEMILSCQCSCICFGYHGAEVLAMIWASVYFPVRDELMIFG